MKIIRIADRFGTDVSSRSNAAQLRLEICQLAASPEQIQLDFLGVRTISDSFADELFAVLVEERGEAWFRNIVQILNVTPLAKNTILDAVAGRLHA